MEFLQSRAVTVIVGACVGVLGTFLCQLVARRWRRTDAEAERNKLLVAEARNALIGVAEDMRQLCSRAPNQGFLCVLAEYEERFVRAVRRYRRELGPDGDPTVTNLAQACLDQTPGRKTSDLEADLATLLLHMTTSRV